MPKVTASNAIQHLTKNSATTEEPWQHVQVTETGTVDTVADGPQTEYEEDEKNGYIRVIGTHIDESGKLWPELRKMRVMASNLTRGDINDLSEGEGQYKHNEAPGSYLRFVCLLPSSLYVNQLC